MPFLDVFWETWFPIIFWRGGRWALICASKFIASKNFHAQTCESTTKFIAQEKPILAQTLGQLPKITPQIIPISRIPMKERSQPPTHPSIHPSLEIYEVRSPSWFLRCVDHISSASPESHSTPLLERAPWNLEDLNRERYRSNTTPEDDPRPAKWALLRAHILDWLGKRSKIFFFKDVKFERKHNQMSAMSVFKFKCVCFLFIRRLLDHP